MRLPFLLVIASAALSGYSLIASRGKGLLNWAVLLLAAALIVADL
jgi:hypothetical protein